MASELILYLMLGIFFIALLYSSVGHAGASGYIAVMSLLALAPAEIKATALVLNVLVASIASWQFFRAGHFSWSLFWPFALLAVPCAALGGYLSLPSQLLKWLLSLVLFYSALSLLFSTQSAQAKSPSPPSRGIAMFTGMGIGFFAGLTGTGGGIFLTPLLLLMKWATAKSAAAVSALFILLNSISGLSGLLLSGKTLPKFIFPLLCVAGIGGIVGSYWGSRRFEATTIKRLLAVVLIIAGGKLMLT
ncbi:MAG: hypothetical protein RL358_1109 [Pseudomonadota bacterium]|jgi:uncharacterized membrane protein YfcA